MVNTFVYIHMGLTPSGSTLDLFENFYFVPILALPKKIPFYSEMAHKPNNM
jgi:hypothetical protein